MAADLVAARRRVVGRLSLVGDVAEQMTLRVLWPRLAEVAAPHFGAPIVPALRRRWGPAQAGRSFGERLVAGDALFTLAHEVSGHVLLVDDVVTSGSTAHAAAAELLCAGASAVSLVVLGAAGPLRRVPVGIS